jgi:hypothetical protein
MRGWGCRTYYVVTPKEPLSVPLDWWRAVVSLHSRNVVAGLPHHLDLQMAKFVPFSPRQTFSRIRMFDEIQMNLAGFLTPSYRILIGAVLHVHQSGCLLSRIVLRLCQVWAWHVAKFNLTRKSLVQPRLCPGGEGFVGQALRSRLRTMTHNVKQVISNRYIDKGNLTRLLQQLFGRDFTVEVCLDPDARTCEYMAEKTERGCSPRISKKNTLLWFRKRWLRYN